MTLPPEFISDLRRRFSGDIRLDRVTRSLYSTDASIYQIEPLGVVLPKNQEDLHAAVELAAHYQIPILPRGSGSSLAGQAIGPALILDCSRYLDQILEIDPQARTATVEPGVILARLNRAAAQKGLQFGPDPASAERATLGGVVGNNATGAHSILYGMTADHLLSADVIQADGRLATWQEMSIPQASLEAARQPFLQTILAIRERHAAAIRSRWPQSWRNSAGYRLNYLLPWSPSLPSQFSGGENRSGAGETTYPPISPGRLNLAPLLAGSEGTLAVLRRVTVNLVPKPRQTVLALLQYDSLAAACDDVPRLLKYSPSAVELIPRMLIQLARGVPAYAAQVNFVEGDPAALLAVEFSGSDLAQLERRARQLGENIRVATTVTAQNQIWNVRKVGLGIFDSRPAAARPIAFIEDCAIPVEHLGDFVREVERLLVEHGTTSAIYAHASAGCLHIRPLIDLRTGQGVRALRSISEQVLALTLRLGGSMSSEHGDGLARSAWLRETYGDELVQAMTALKRAADPQNLLNPGKIIAPPPIDANLRYGAGYQSEAWPAALQFPGGLATAIEQCNGQGVCRKDSGVMCPSFQATRDELHSTRGRANLLRAMIRLGEAGLPAEQVKPALDLCLACKGCQAECPSGVDMARLKYEFQNHYYQTHRRPLRDYLFGYINQLAPLGAPLGGLLNRLGKLPLARWMARSVGIASQRPLPQFHRADVRPVLFRAPVEKILFLSDTFSRYFEPEIESAALHLLAACQVDVRPISLPGAGRTLLSKGFIEPARRHAARLLDEIQRLDPRGELPVVGLEPSEIYTLRDEFMALLPARKEEAQALAARAWMIDEFLIRPAANSSAARLSRADWLTQTESPKILLHGHCYQKAQPPRVDGYPVGVNASAALLQAAGYAPEVIPSGCCGMAGAFGYEAEHYPVSMQVGELALFPAIRKTGAGGQPVLVAAAGTSCRAQILDGTGMQAAHAVVLADKMLIGQR